MIDYKGIWASINEESKTGGVNSNQIARMISADGVYSVFLVTDFSKSIRSLYIKLPVENNILLKELPVFRGLDISLIYSNIGLYKNQLFLRLQQTIYNTDNIFESVISDICDKILRIEQPHELQPILIKILNEWRLFFENYDYEILSISAQKGLIGELLFIKDYLLKKYSLTLAVHYWTGTDRTNHDFQIDDLAVEIKATSSKQHKKFTVSSEKQLDDTGLRNLYLGLFSLNHHHNLHEKSLPFLIVQIREIIKKDPVASFSFDMKLLKRGYHDKDSDKYVTGYSLVNAAFYEVRPGFPRMLSTNLPNGIGDLSYTVMISSCAPFEITSDILKKI